jgi:hypothetical protein
MSTRPTRCGHGFRICAPLLAALAITQLACAAAARPGPESLAPGTRVRAVYPATGEVVVGTIERHVLGSLDLHTDSSPDPRRVVLGDLAALDISHGRQTWRAAAIGASVGTIGGMLAGMACGASCVSDHPGMAGVFGAAIGAAAGGIVGIVLAPEAWVGVELRLVR